MYSDKNHFNPEAWKATRNMKIQQFEKDHNCIFANNLRAEYGNGWYSMTIYTYHRKSITYPSFCLRYTGQK